MGKVRIQVILESDEKERIGDQARKHGESLSGWLRSAGLTRLESVERVGKLDSPTALRSFFARCDKLGGSAKEPDWDEHLEVIRRSRRSGGTGT